VACKRIAVLTARNLRNNQTQTEKIFWEIVRKRRFLGLRFLRQRPILCKKASYEWFFVADFLCAEKNLIVELDGPIHEKTSYRDVLRDQILNQLGYKVLRIKNDEVLDLKSLELALKDALQNPPPSLSAPSG
jgi:very-short-patch-repair endonuclease